MAKSNSKSGPFGPHHADAIRRANRVPDAAKSFPNTNPGYSGPPLIHVPKDAPGTKGKR